VCCRFKKKRKRKKEEKKKDINKLKDEGLHQESPRRDLNTGCETKQIQTKTKSSSASLFINDSRFYQHVIGVD